ncbi:MAG: phosphonopyruvate decarboxylase [Deltaproteobacteria bacterium]|nr:phosphonopyruvate decarboxylase [Deltaproteobacteria bacterium]
MHIDDFGKVLKRHGLRSGAGVPCSYFTPLVNYTTQDPELDYLSASSEGEAVAIGAGMVAAGRPAFALMQNSGLGNAVNPITSLLYIYKIPLALLVSHRGQPGRPDEPQHELMGQITEELARLCQLRTHVLNPERFSDELRASLGDGVPAAWVCRKGAFEGGVKAPAVKAMIHSAAVTPASQGEFAPALRREEALHLVLPLLSAGIEHGEAPAVISTTGKLSRELYELDDADHSKRNRFYMVGSMGCAAGFGLGVARAQPKRKVVVLDGDGALLMKLGTLATIGHVRAENLHHVVFDNGAHESTGGQPTSSPSIDFATMALAAGYRVGETVSEGAAFREAFERHMAQPGPTLLRMVIHVGARADLGRPKRTPQEAYGWFQSYLAGQ